MDKELLNRMDEILKYSYAICFFLVLPLLGCLLFGRIRRLSLWLRILIAIPVYSIFSWLCVNGFIWLRYLIDPMSLRGPEGVFGLFFGWMYLWFTSIPVFIAYGFSRAVYLTVKKNRQQVDNSAK